MTRWEPQNKFEPYKFNDQNKASHSIIRNCIEWDADPRMIKFILHLNHIGLFARPYDEDAELRCQALYTAGRVIHHALCALDPNHFSNTKHTTIRDFANAWSYANGENRRHDD